MADHVAGDEIYVYTGGIAPEHVVNAIIDESVEEIDDVAFQGNDDLKSVVCHDRVLKVGCCAFLHCRSLQRVKMPGVKIIEQYAFYDCRSMKHVELDNLETIGWNAFVNTSLQRVKMPKVKIIGTSAFKDSDVEELELGEDLETVGPCTFRRSRKLRRIAIPLRDGMFQLNDSTGTYTQFCSCPNLETVDLVGGIHKTVASLHLEGRRKMKEEIQRINEVLPGTASDSKAGVIRQWIRSVIIKIDHYKAEHRALLEEATTLLELVLWKIKLADLKDEEGEHSLEEPTAAKKAKIDVDEARKEARITSGADIVIMNVLPFLMLVE